MGFFSKKKEVPVDKTEKCKEIYRDINKIMQNARDEGDLEIRLSQLQLASTKYDDILTLIDQGADFERSHFEGLKDSVDKEIVLYKGL
ncbi:MAG: hypothetical protein ACK5LC_10540 [Coprobacillaceae bacterium]